MNKSKFPNINEISLDKVRVLVLHLRRARERGFPGLTDETRSTAEDRENPQADRLGA